MLKGYTGRVYLLFISLFLIGHNLFSQAFQSINYTIENNLAQDYVYAFVQDTSGYLWIGTGDGLSCFDGKKFRNYTIETGLSENFIKTLYIDNDGTVWVGHYEGGISYYKDYVFNKIKKHEQLSSPINAIFKDRKGRIWVGTQSDGLFRIKNNHLEVVKTTTDLSTVFSINELPDGSLLLGTNTGLYNYNVKGGEFSIIGNGPLLSQPTQFISKKLNKDGYWILTKEGLYHLNKEGKTFPRAIIFPPDFSFENINCMLEDQFGALFLGTHGQGLYKIVLKKGRAEIIEHLHRENGLSNNYVKALFYDREYNIWMGTYGGGVNKLLDLEFRIFPVFNKEDNLKISALFRDSDNFLWTGSDLGLSKIDFSKFQSNTKSNTETYIYQNGIEKVTSLTEDVDKNILIGTEKKGVFKFHPTTKTFTTYFSPKNNPSANKIKDIVLDYTGRTWIATNDGAYILDKKGSVQAHYTIGEGLLHNIVNDFYIDEKKNVWIITQGAGLSKFIHGKLTTYKFPDQIITNINCIAEDNLGTIWIGTNGAGIFTFANGKFSQSITKEDGLASNYCYAISCDKYNNVWIIHSDGLTKFSPSALKVRLVKEINGIPIPGINHNLLIKDKDQNHWFGLHGNLVKYMPDIESLNVNKPLPKIKGLDLFFAKVNWKNFADSLYGEFKLPHRLVLKHDENHLNFRFDAITFKSPEKVNYVYILEGFDQKWSLPTPQEYATYAKLPPGDYEFKASAISTSGEVSKPAVFRFRIDPPFWKTWTFIFLISVIGVFTVSGAIHLRIKNLEEKHLFLQQQQEKLTKTNKELSTFIYRSSHDLKGPLMSILGLANLGNIETENATSSNYFTKISQTSIKLDNILKELMQVTEIKEWNLRIETIEFNKLIGKLLDEMKESRDISIVSVDIKVWNNFNSDYQLIYYGLKAVLDNAFRYLNPLNNEPRIDIKIESYKKGVRIRVEDNGIGINDKIIDKVPEMFYKGTETSSGFGLGLYLLTNCMDKLNGYYYLRSKENEYTILTMVLRDLHPEDYQ